jgi:hypothetical protein
MQSLLVTNITQSLELGDVQGEETDIFDWNQLVEELLSQILNSALGFKLGLKPWKSYEFGQGR